MDRHLLREVLACFVSGLAHVGMFGALFIAGNSNPTPLPTRPGRASMALTASMAASPRPQEVDDLKLPISIEFSRPAPSASKLNQTVSLLDRKVPELNVGPRIELPRPHGTRRPVVPARGNEKLEQAAQDLLSKATETVARRATRPPKVEPKAVLAAIASQASAASQAMAGTETDDPPRTGATNPEPAYPPDALAAGLQGLVKVRVTVKPDGTAAAIALAQSSGTASLDASALATVKFWRFEPGRRAGRAVIMDVIVPIRFTIRPR